MGIDAVHHLHDAFSTYFTANDMTEDRNPLAVSYKTKHIPRRYDYIYSSGKWRPKNVEYRYNEAVTATSDHAIVIGEFLKEMNEN